MKRRSWKAWAIVRNGLPATWFGRYDILPHRVSVLDGEELVRVTITEAAPARKRRARGK